MRKKPLAAKLSGVKVSLSSAIKCLPLSPMNCRITGETVHCCLKASMPVIHVSPPRPPLLPFARPRHKPRQCPPLSLLSVTMSASRPFYLCLSSYLWSLCHSHDVCRPHSLLMYRGCSATLTHTGPTSEANEQALIKGINQ